MTTHLWVISVALGVTALINWGSVLRGDHVVERITKPLVVLLLMGLAWSLYWEGRAPGSPPLLPVIVALAFCLLGDIALLHATETRFLVGLGAFLVGHLAYVWAILETVRADGFPWPILVAVPFLAVLHAKAGRDIVRHSGTQRGPVFVYQARPLRARARRGRHGRLAAAARVHGLRRLRHRAGPRPLRPREALGAAHGHRDLPRGPDPHRRSPLPLTPPPPQPVEWPPRPIRLTGVPTHLVEWPCRREDQTTYAVEWPRRHTAPSTSLSSLAGLCTGADFAVPEGEPTAQGVSVAAPSTTRASGSDEAVMAARQVLLQECRVTLSALPADSAFSHVTAARLLGLPMSYAMEEDVRLHVMRPIVRNRVRLPGVIGHRALHARQIVDIDGLPVVDVADTWVDLGEPGRSGQTGGA